MLLLGPVERIFLSAPVVVARGREANLTAVLWPSQPRTATFYWWFNNNTEVRTFIRMRPRGPHQLASYSSITSDLQQNKGSAKDIVLAKARKVNLLLGWIGIGVK